VGLFDKLLKKEDKTSLPKINVSDDAIVALADGELIDIHTVNDPAFSQELMGKGVAFRYSSEKIVLCSPVNGNLVALFPTGHAFGVRSNNGVELLVHCGIDTIDAKGDGFTLLNKKQGCPVKAGDPIVEVDVNKLSKKYDMSTMLIITNDNGRNFSFIEPKQVKMGDNILRSR